MTALAVHDVDDHPASCVPCARYRFEPKTPRVHAPAPLPGGYGVCEPPDPIPNSAVKPDCADGTIAQAMEE